MLFGPCVMTLFYPSWLFCFCNVLICHCSLTFGYYTLLFCHCILVFFNFDIGTSSFAVVICHFHSVRFVMVFWQGNVQFGMTLRNEFQTRWFISRQNYNYVNIFPLCRTVLVGNMAALRNRAVNLLEEAIRLIREHTSQGPDNDSPRYGAVAGAVNGRETNGWVQENFRNLFPPHTARERSTSFSSSSGRQCIVNLNPPSNSVYPEFGGGITLNSEGLGPRRSVSNPLRAINLG